MESVRHYYCEISADLLAKPKAVRNLVETTVAKNVLIFCESKSDTQLIETLLRKRGIEARRLNCDVGQNNRLKIENLIKDGSIKILALTNFAARNLNIKNAELIINYSIEQKQELYEERCKTASKDGQIVSLIAPRDVASFHFLTKVIPVKFEKMALPTSKQIDEVKISNLCKNINCDLASINQEELGLAKSLLSSYLNEVSARSGIEQIVAKLLSKSNDLFTLPEKPSLEDELEPSFAMQEVLNYRQETKAKEFDDFRHKRSNRNDNYSWSRQNQNTNDCSEETHKHSEDARLYIGQGTSDGMTADLFKELANEFADIKSHEIFDLVVYDNYGFVTTSCENAESIINSLNGIEYNSKLLPIEYAATLRKERSSTQNREDHREFRREHYGKDKNRRNNRFQQKRGGGRRGQSEGRRRY